MAGEFDIGVDNYFNFSQFGAALYKGSNGEWVISYEGSNPPLDHPYDWVQNAIQGLGYYGDYFWTALDFYRSAVKFIESQSTEPATIT
jgi:hypothetical protein